MKNKGRFEPNKKSAVRRREFVVRAVIFALYVLVICTMCNADGINTKVVCIIEGIALGGALSILISNWVFAPTNSKEVNKV